MRPTVVFAAASKVEKYEFVRVVDAKFVFALGQKLPTKASYVYGMAMMDAIPGEFVAVDIGDAIQRQQLCRSLDGAEAELADLLREIENGDG